MRNENVIYRWNINRGTSLEMLKRAGYSISTFEPVPDDDDASAWASSNKEASSLTRSGEERAIWRKIEE